MNILFNPRLTLSVLFAVSCYILSTDNSLKIFSMNASSIISIFMVFLWLSEVLLRGKVYTRKHPLSRLFLLLLLWSAVSLWISQFNPAKVIPLEAYQYLWAGGLNSPKWRGLSFVFRLFLSIFAISFIVNSIDNIKKYTIVINSIIITHTLAVCYGLCQLLLFIFFHTTIGYITTQSEGLFRIGAYIGEPQTYALVLITGFFPIFAALIYPLEGIHFKRSYLTLLLGLTLVVMLFTYSAAVLSALTITLLILMRNKLKSKYVLLLGLLMIIIATTSFNRIQDMVISKIFNEVSSINTRSITWQLGLEMFRQNPMTGVGIGQAPLVNSRYIPKELAPEYEILLEYDKIRQPPMNSYIEIAAEMGIVGLGIILLIGLQLFFIGHRMKGTNLQFVITGFGGALVAFGIAANATPGNFYAGFIQCSIALYLSGYYLFYQDTNPVKAII